MNGWNFFFHKYGFQPSRKKIGKSLLLEAMQKGAQKAALMVKMENTNRNELLEKWTEQLKTAWPSSLLFQNE